MIVSIRHNIRGIQILVSFKLKHNILVLSMGAHTGEKKGSWIPSPFFPTGFLGV